MAVFKRLARKILGFEINKLKAELAEIKEHNELLYDQREALQKERDDLSLRCRVQQMYIDDDEAIAELLEAETILKRAQVIRESCEKVETRVYYDAMRDQHVLRMRIANEQAKIAQRHADAMTKAVQGQLAVRGFIPSAIACGAGGAGGLGNGSSYFFLGNSPATASQQSTQPSAIEQLAYRNARQMGGIGSPIEYYENLVNGDNND